MSICSNESKFGPYLLNIVGYNGGWRAECRLSWAIRQYTAEPIKQVNQVKYTISAGEDRRGSRATIQFAAVWAEVKAAWWNEIRDDLNSYQNLEWDIRSGTQDSARSYS